LILRKSYFIYPSTEFPWGPLIENLGSGPTREAWKPKGSETSNGKAADNSENWLTASTPVCLCHSFTHNRKQANYLSKQPRALSSKDSHSKSVHTRLLCYLCHF